MFLTSTQRGNVEFSDTILVRRREAENADRTRKNPTQARRQDWMWLHSYHTLAVLSEKIRVNAKIRSYVYGDLRGGRQKRY